MQPQVRNLVSFQVAAATCRRPAGLLAHLAGCTWGVMVGRLQTPAVFHTSHPAQADDAMPVPWPPVLQEAQLRRGLGYYGSGARLERVVAKLMAGEPIVAATVGGSVTVGSGSSNLTENGYAPRQAHAAIQTSKPTGTRQVTCVAACD
jgi:hypothetical protein